MEVATKEAHSTLTREADNMAWFYDAYKKEAPLYVISDKVWLNGWKIATTHLMKKLDHKWLCPYPIDKIISWSTYQLKLPSSFGWAHPVFSVTLLRPYNADTIAEWIQCDPPPPVIHDGIKEYEVECFLDSQIFRGKLKYLVWWKGYGIEEDEWRWSEDVKGAKRPVSEFHRQNHKAPQDILSHRLFQTPFLPPHQLHWHPRHSPFGLGYWSMCVESLYLWRGDECQGSFYLELYHLSQVLSAELSLYHLANSDVWSPSPLHQVPSGMFVWAAI